MRPRAMKHSAFMLMFGKIEVSSVTLYLRLGIDFKFNERL